MSGPKRNPDALNTIGVVVVGICGAVLVYVSIVALQAFYMNDSSEVVTMADYGGQDLAHQSLRASQINVVEDCGPNAKPEAGKQQTYRIPIKYAIKLVADEAKRDASSLVPTQGPSDKPTILPIFGRPKIAPPAATPPADGGAVNVPMTPTGGQGMGGGQPAGAPSGAGAADPNPTTAPTPGGNPPTPNPKAGESDRKGGTAAPKTGSAAKPATGSAAKPAKGSAK